MYRVESGLPLRAEDEPRRVETEAARLAAAWPENHLAQAGVVSAQLALGRAGDALARARSLADRHPRAAAYRYLEGLALEGLGRTGEAAEAFVSARRREPEFLPPYPALAEILARGESAETALEVMEEYSRRQRFRLSARDHLLLASLRHRRQAVAGAADAYERALWQLRENDPLREEALSGLADVRVDSGQAEEALTLLEDRTSPAASLVRARALRALGRIDEAREILLRLTSHPDVAPALREMARAELARATKPAQSR
jgi:predicted Zn-dependent protease